MARNTDISGMALTIDANDDDRLSVTVTGKPLDGAPTFDEAKALLLLAVEWIDAGKGSQ